MDLNRRQFMQSMGVAAAFAAVGGVSASPQFRRGPMAGGTIAEGDPESVGMSAARLDDVFARVGQRVVDGLYPGATAMVVRQGKIVGQQAFGVKERGTDEAMTLDTLFDLESMTKVLATSTSAMILVEQGKLSLDDKVADYLSDFAANGKEDITVRDMLRYSAGLPVDNQFLDNEDDDAVWKLMAETATEYEPGTMVEYSDLTYRLLGKLIETVAGMSLEEFARANIWQPLGMNDTMYNPPEDLKPRIAATGPTTLRDEMLRGVVQDDQDWMLGGIVGCDGVFSTLGDIAVFCQMIMNSGTYNGVDILKPESVAEMVKNQTPQVTEADTDLNPIYNLILTPKGYGFELWTHRFSTGGMHLSPDSYGKTGGAGTFMWLDPQRELFGILLTNHGLPVPFDEPGWHRLIYDTAPGEFFDGIIAAITDEA
jgi:serine-type D-Ala-D-Ala carboxypeptidase